MTWAVFLKDDNGWFLFKAFKTQSEALRSHHSFRSKGFDCVLVLAEDCDHLRWLREAL